jgi:hypothetical protein
VAKGHSTVSQTASSPTGNTLPNAACDTNSTATPMDSYAIYENNFEVRPVMGNQRGWRFGILSAEG